MFLTVPQRGPTGQIPRQIEGVEDPPVAKEHPDTQENFTAVFDDKTTAPGRPDRRLPPDQSFGGTVPTPSNVPTKPEWRGGWFLPPGNSRSHWLADDNDESLAGLTPRAKSESDTGAKRPGNGPKVWEQGLVVALATGPATRSATQPGAAAVRTGIPMETGPIKVGDPLESALRSASVPAGPDGNPANPPFGPGALGRALAEAAPFSDPTQTAQQSTGVFGTEQISPISLPDTVADGQGTKDKGRGSRDAAGPMYAPDGPRTARGGHDEMTASGPDPSESSRLRSGRASQAGQGLHRSATEGPDLGAVVSAPADGPELHRAPQPGTQSFPPAISVSYRVHGKPGPDLLVRPGPESEGQASPAASGAPTNRKLAPGGDADSSPRSGPHLPSMAVIQSTAGPTDTASGASIRSDAAAMAGTPEDQVRVRQSLPRHPYVAAAALSSQGRDATAPVEPSDDPMTTTPRLGDMTDALPDLVRDDVGLIGGATRPEAMQPEPVRPTVAHDIPRPVALQLADAVQNRPDSDIIDITLSPEDLGPVRLTLHHGDRGLLVQVQAERPETADLIRRHLPELDRTLRDLGHGSVAFSFGDQPRQGRDSAAPNHPKSDGMAAPIDPGAALAPLVLTPTRGLDIRL